MSYLTSIEVAKLLSISEVTLRQSRVTGKLLGSNAPRHLKLGRQVRYVQSDIDQWIIEVNQEEAA
jgi:predicted DNA-binding transcriptional regulator AlpA